MQFLKKTFTQKRLTHCPHVSMHYVNHIDLNSRRQNLRKKRLFRYPKENGLAYTYNQSQAYLARYRPAGLNIPGGNIKNIALAAAFYAAESNNSITMEHIKKAGKREFGKRGRLRDEKAWGRYDHAPVNRALSAKNVVVYYK